MANEKNLKPIRSKSEAREKGRKGGIASGVARREQHTIESIAQKFFYAPVSDEKALEKAAKQLGLTSKSSKGELLLLRCLMQSIQKGDVKDVEIWKRLLGEDCADNSTEANEQESLLMAIKEAVQNED